jgi:hypothetical protein
VVSASLPFPPKKKSCFLLFKFVYDDKSLGIGENQMSNIVIEKDIELPTERTRHSYPYRMMEIGDSFFVEDSKISVMCNNNYRMGKLLKKKFIARVEGKGVRVWRTA